LNRLTKSGLRQFVAAALMRAWKSREAETRGGSDRGKYNFKSITADETEFMFLVLCPCDGLVDAAVAALNAHQGQITPRPAPVEDPIPDCIHACGLLLTWYLNSMTPDMMWQQIFACKKEGGQAMLALQQIFAVRNMLVAKCVAAIIPLPPRKYPELAVHNATANWGWRRDMLSWRTRVKATW